MLCLAFLYADIAENHRRNYVYENQIEGLMWWEANGKKGLAILNEVAEISNRAFGQEHAFTMVSKAEIGHVKREGLVY